MGRSSRPRGGGVFPVHLPRALGGKLDHVPERWASLHVLLGTLTPAGGTLQAGSGTPEANATREQINAWIPTNSGADVVIDFDAALRDPQDPTRLNRACDSSDHLHPNLAGHQAMAEAVDLAQLTGPACHTGR